MTFIFYRLEFKSSLRGLLIYTVIEISSRQKCSVAVRCAARAEDDHVHAEPAEMPL